MLTPLLLARPFLCCFLPKKSTFDVELERLDADERCFLPTDDTLRVELEILDAGECRFLPIYSIFFVFLEISDASEACDRSLARPFVKFRKVENKAKKA